MKRTYVNRLPKNEEVKNTNVKVENGELVVEVEFEDKFEPKDGDFCATDNGCIFIYNSNYKLRSNYLLGYYVGIDCYNDITINEDNRSGFSNEVRRATPEEKVAFLERLEKECHKRWNEETKKLEDIQWRAKMRERYYFVTSACDVATCEESNLGCDNAYYNLGNYFRNVEAAQKVADQIKDIFKNSKAE